MRHIAACVVLGLTACARLQAEPATPPVDGGRVVGPITPMAKSPADEAERLALIEAALTARREVEAKYPPPLVIARRVADGAIQIDGKIDEEAWQATPEISSFRETRSGEPVKNATRARVAWDARNLYIAFDGEDPDVAATIDERDGELWREDAFEAFIDPTGGGTSYIELEVSPKNVVHDATIADYRPEVNWITDLAHLDMTKAPKVYDAAGLRSAVNVRGTLNKNDDKDQGWSAEIAIPWDDIRRGANTYRLPPADGDVWRIGLYRINVDVGVPQGSSFGAWNPTTSWFHVPWSYGHVLFAEQAKK